MRLASVARDLLKLIRDYTKGITDDSIKGLLRSIGDAGAGASNVTGKTLLKLLTDLYERVKIFDTATKTQVLKYGIIAPEGGTTIIYTVPADKTFYLTYFNLTPKSGTSGYCVTLKIRDENDNLVMTLARSCADSPADVEGCLVYPIKVPANYDIFLESGTSSPGAMVAIVGWIE